MVGGQYSPYIVKELVLLLHSTLGRRRMLTQSEGTSQGQVTKD